MKQENPKNSRKKVWLIVAIIAAVVAIGVALAFILPGLLQPQEQGGETLENPEIYFNLDRTQMIDPETTLSTRTPGEDGLYHVRFSVYGEVKEVSVINDKKLINFMDTLDVLCPVFDANGVITDVQNADQYFMVTKDLYVKRMQNGNLEANSSTAMNGMDVRFAMNEASGIYDCQPTAANPGTPSEADWLDKIIAVTDKGKTFAHIYIVDNVAFEGEVAWRAEKSMYDSTKQATKREPDENGVYTIPFFIDGKLVERKSKNKDKVSQIDKLEQFVCVVALEYDEEGYIIDWHSPALALRGFELCKGYTVTAVENGTFSATRLLSGTKQGDMVEATYDDTCKIWNVCRGCNADVPHATKTTELKVGDLVSVYTDLDGKPLEIYVGLRTVDSPMYYNVTRKWSTAEAKSTRVPDEEGYYHIDLAVNGKVKEFKTKNVEHVNYIDSLYYFACGLKTSGNIIKEVYAGNCVCGYTGAFVNRYVSNLAGAVVSVVLPPDMDAGKNYLTSGKCEIYDVSGESGKPIGQKTTLKKGDRVVGFIDTNSKLTHVYVTQRYNPDMQVAYNMERMYNATTKSTTRVPDAEGYYVYNLALNGTVKQYKTKNKALADFIDLQHRPIVGVKVSGNIIKDACYAYSTILYGAKNFSGHRVKDTKGGTLNTYYFSGTERVDSNLEYKITSKTKIYNVSSIYDKQVGEKTKLKADDLIQAVVDTANKEVTHIYVIERTVKCDLYWPVSRVTGTHINEDGVKVTDRTPNAEGYYVFQMLHNGEQVTLKTKDILVATKVDSLNQAMGLVVEGDIIKQWVPLASTSHFQTLAGNFDITKVTKDTIYATRYYASASNYGTEAVIKYNKNTKFICTITSSENYGKLVTPKVGDRITMYGGSSGVATYGFITQENTHQKGMLSYCPHCNKTVFWDKWGSSNIADGMHCYLTNDIATSYSFGVNTDDKNCDMVLDLNGYTLSGGNLLVDVYDKLTIVDTVGGGKISGGGAGNIRVNPGATLTVLSGTIENGSTTLTGVGGNIYADNATVNIKGGTISGGVSYLGSNIYHVGTKGSVNITGGKITNGSVYAESSKVINVSGNVEINNLIVKPGNIINVGKLSSGASITVKADGVFTNNGAASYIKNFKVTDAADAIAASGTALTYTNNSGVVVPAQPSINGPLVLDANSEALCMVCGEKVKWAPIHDGEVGPDLRNDPEYAGTANGLKYHFYLADDNMITGNDDFLYNYKYATICLHLNGKTANLKGGIYGGNASTLNIMGEGTLNHLGNATGGVTKARFILLDTASVNLYGGTFESNATAFQLNGTNSKLNIAGNAIVNEAIDLKQGKVTIDGAAKIQKINISASGKLTVKADFTGSAVVDVAADKVESGVVKTANGASTGDFAGQIITSEGNVIKGQDNKLVITATKVTPPTITDEDITVVDPTVFDPENNNGEAYCTACGKKVVWTALNAQNPIAGETTANSHFYFAESYVHTAGGNLLKANKDGSAVTTVCLNLNGKAVTTNANIYGTGSCNTNVMDSGENGSITYTGTGSLFDFYTANLKIYGGTYNSTTGNVAKIQRSNWQHLYGNTAINGKVVVDSGATQATNLAVHDNASIADLQVGAKGKLIIVKDWAGTIAKVTFANALVENKVPATNASADVFTGTITMADGRVLTKDTESTQLVATEQQLPPAPPADDSNEFDPEANGGVAYCPVCKTEQNWIAVTGKLGTVSDDAHYYLAQSIAYEGTAADDYFIQTTNGKNVHFNMNGYSITPKEGAAYATGAYLTGSMDLFNTSETESYWSSTCATFGEFVVRNSTTEFVLHDGVTLQATGSNTSQPVVGIYSGTFILNGGTVSAAGKDNNIVIQPRVHNTKSLFVMNSGEVICGTTGTAIRVGEKSAISATTGAVLNGGAITGKAIAQGGYLQLDKTANPTNVTITANGKLVVKETWTGNTVAGFTPAPVNGVVAAANGEATGAFTGGLFLADGNKLVKSATSTQLVMNDVIAAAAAMTFPTDGSSKVMDCPACGAKDATWTAYTGTAPTATAHLYVPADVEYSGTYMTVESGSAVICLHLNGKNITAKADGKNAFTVNKLNIMGNGVVTGNGVEPLNSSQVYNAVGVVGTAFHMNFGKGSGLVNIYGGTYKKLATNTFNPIVTIGQNGGTVNMYGGIIDASGTTVTTQPGAVALQGSATGATSVSAPAYFNMYGGEIKGGTTNSLGGAIRVGAISSDAKYLDSAHFVMHAGKITGGVANNGGAIYADKNCGTLAINGGIITGGQAKLSGGNIYATNVDLTIGAGATIQNGTAGETTTTTTGIGGGNIWFGTGTLTTAGKILNGECLSVKGGGGNIFLNKDLNGNTEFYMTGGEIKGGKLPTADAQNYGCNIRAYNVAVISVTGGEISGGIGGYAGTDNPRDRGRNLYAGYGSATYAAQVTLSNCTIDGEVFVNGGTLTLSGDLVIGGTERGLDLDNNIAANVTGLTNGASIKLSGLDANTVFSGNCGVKAAELAQKFTMIDTTLEVAANASSCLYVKTK